MAVQVDWYNLWWSWVPVAVAVPSSVWLHSWRMRPVWPGRGCSEPAYVCCLDRRYSELLGTTYKIFHDINTCFLEANNSRIYWIHDYHNKWMNCIWIINALKFQCPLINIKLQWHTKFQALTFSAVFLWQLQYVSCTDFGILSVPWSLCGCGILQCQSIADCWKIESNIKIY